MKSTVPPNGQFNTTHWSVVVLAGRNDTVRAETALTELCRLYWYPLYAFVRRRGYSAEDAEDATQEYFASLVQSRFVTAADPAKGKFRSWLLGGMKHFLSNQRRHDQAKKRGGDCETVSFDAQEADRRYALEPADASSPEAIYERRWALIVLNQAIHRLEAEQVQAGNSARFEALKECLLGERADLPYAQLAEKLATTEDALKSMVQRLRQRYKELLRAVIADTVETPAEVEEELKNLLEILRR